MHYFVIFYRNNKIFHSKYYDYEQNVSVLYLKEYFITSTRIIF